MKDYNILSKFREEGFVMAFVGLTWLLTETL